MVMPPDCQDELPWTGERGLDWEEAHMRIEVGDARIHFDTRWKVWCVARRLTPEYTARAQIMDFTPGGWLTITECEEFDIAWHVFGLLVGVDLERRDFGDMPAF